MSGDSETLARVLKAEPPPTVAALPAEVQASLAKGIESARRRQSDIIDEAVVVALKGVPLPVRGIVRKALLG